MKWDDSTVFKTVEASFGLGGFDSFPLRQFFVLGSPEATSRHPDHPTTPTTPTDCTLVQSPPCAIKADMEPKMPLFEGTCRHH